jgi:nucleoid DNA-binding protein
VTKLDIVKIVREEAKIKRQSGVLAINLILSIVKQEILNGGKVSIHNFGVFHKKYRGKFRPSPRLHQATNNPDYDF